MIFRKALTYAAAAVVMATAAGVFVVALAFALFALARDALGAPGAAAVVAVAAAILVAIIGLIISQKAHTKTAKYMNEDVPLTTRLIDLAKERPIVAGVAALAATVFIARNPKMMTGLLSAVLAARAAKGPPPSPSKKR